MPVSEVRIPNPEHSFQHLLPSNLGFLGLHTLPLHSAVLEMGLFFPLDVNRVWQLGVALAEAFLKALPKALWMGEAGAASYGVPCDMAAPSDPPR